MIHIFYRLGRLYATFTMPVVLALLCASTTVGLGLAVPWILKEVLDYGLAQRQTRFLYMAGGILVAVTMVRGVVAYGQSYLGAALAQQLAYRLRQLFYVPIQRLSFAYHDRTPTGELMSRATADVEAVRLFFQFGWTTGFSVALTGLGTIIAMAWLDWRLAALTLVSLPFFLGVILGIGRLLQSLQLRVQETTAALTVILQESLAGIRVVKAFARTRQQTQAFAEAAAALSQAHIAVAAKEALNFPLLTLCLALVLALTLYIGGRQVMVGAMSLGTLVAAAGYLAQLAQPLRRLSWLTGMTSLCQDGAARLFGILDAVMDVDAVATACS